MYRLSYTIHLPIFHLFRYYGKSRSFIQDHPQMGRRME
nr:MAG TPA: hypothetical protein [Caudoviricetes sp.]